MKVYVKKSQGETDHLSCNGDIIEALQFYLEETGCESEDIDSISLFAREKWKDVTITYDVDDLKMIVEKLQQKERIKAEINRLEKQLNE